MKQFILAAIAVLSLSVGGAYAAQTQVAPVQNTVPAAPFAGGGMG
jgi:hypothetical protein